MTTAIDNSASEASDFEPVFLTVRDYVTVPESMVESMAMMGGLTTVRPAFHMKPGLLPVPRSSHISRGDGARHVFFSSSRRCGKSAALGVSPPTAS